MADDSDSSALSEHSEKEIQKLAPIFLKAKKATKLVAPPPPVSPPRPKRPPSPPHEEVLADNPDIAFIVMFRSRFSDLMSSKLPHFGPQDIERGVVDAVPSLQVQQLMCALLGLVLNRKKPVERGHHLRALEEAIQSHKSQWPLKWNGQNPLHGGKSFDNMTPSERLNLLRTLVMWSLSSSDAIQATLKEKYKQNRHNDDENQPLSVQPWGTDGDKRRYFLIQGLDDTSFRVYREGNRYTKNAHWWSQAGDIEEVKALAKKLEEEDHSQAARRLAAKITNAVPTFEATEEKRRRREYRQTRRAVFARPEPGFSLYEGRTRGKRMRYTYDDDDDFLSDDDSVRRSTRQSGHSTPFETGPTFTASGRQVRAPKTGDYGESLLSGAVTSADENGIGEQAAAYATRSGTEDSEHPVRNRREAGRLRDRAPPPPQRDQPRRKHIDGYNNIDEMSDEDDANESGDEWDSDKNNDEDDADVDEDMVDADDEDDDDDEMSNDGDVDAADDDLADYRHQSLVVKLKVTPSSTVKPELHSNGTNLESTNDDVAHPKSEPAPAECIVLAPTGPQHLARNDVGHNNTSADPVESADLAPSSSRMSSAYPTPTSSSFLPSEHKSSATSSTSVFGAGARELPMSTTTLSAFQHST